MSIKLRKKLLKYTILKPHCYSHSLVTNNTVTIVIAGPVAKEINEKYDAYPKRSALLLKIFSSVGQDIIPYGVYYIEHKSHP